MKFCLSSKKCKVLKIIYIDQITHMVDTNNMTRSTYVTILSVILLALVLILALSSDGGIINEIF